MNEKYLIHLKLSDVEPWQGQAIMKKKTAFKITFIQFAQTFLEKKGSLKVHYVIYEF